MMMMSPPLRKQIAVCATICDQLLQDHPLPSPLSLCGRGGPPTPVQLQILEQIFEQGNGTPTKQKIKEIASSLSQHGQISQTNVYNWFQNRGARSKRKQLLTPGNNNNNNVGNSNEESGVETEVDSLAEKKTKLAMDMYHHHSSLLPQGADDLCCFQSPEIDSELHFYDALQNSGDDQLMGKPGVCGSCSMYEQAEEHGLLG